MPSPGGVYTFFASGTIVGATVSLQTMFPDGTWGPVQSVASSNPVEHAEFDMKAKGQATDECRRTQSILFGRTSEFKQEAFDTVLAMVAR